MRMAGARVSTGATFDCVVFHVVRVCNYGMWFGGLTDVFLTGEGSMAETRICKVHYKCNL
jgi:hypothetical protein